MYDRSVVDSVKRSCATTRKTYGLAGNVRGVHLAKLSRSGFASKAFRPGKARPNSTIRHMIIQQHDICALLRASRLSNNCKKGPTSLFPVVPVERLELPTL